MNRWLDNYCDGGEERIFPLMRVLHNSLYYPASGFDGDPIKYFSHKINSFIYVDYSRSEDDLKGELVSNSFTGYRLAHSQNISIKQLVPNGWKPVAVCNDSSGPDPVHQIIAKPFAKWLVFERLSDYGPCHGAERFSLLYLCADGVAAYQALYIANHCVPKAIAIIQPGFGFGNNYTDFEDPNRALGQTVLGNKAGRPEILLFGGIGKRDFYRSPCWPEYATHDAFYQKQGGGSIGAWSQ